MSDIGSNATPVNAPYRTRLFALFAADGRHAVILRRGPRPTYRLIAWDLAGHTFTPGQWMNGVIRLCDLSPDGSKLLYWAAQYHRTWDRCTTHDEESAAPYDPAANVPDPTLLRRPKRKVPRYQQEAMKLSKRSTMRPIKDTWTAISTPPYFTALAVWPSVGTWTGGGVFCGARTIALGEGNDGLVPHENVPKPVAWQVRQAGSAALVRSASPQYAESEALQTVRRALIGAGAQWVDWVNLRSADMLFAADGRIYELPGWANVAPERYLADARQLADFRDMRFQQIRAPSAALRW